MLIAVCDGFVPDGILGCIHSKTHALQLQLQRRASAICGARVTLHLGLCVRLNWKCFRCHSAAFHLMLRYLQVPALLCPCAASWIVVPAPEARLRGRVRTRAYAYACTGGHCRNVVLTC